MTQFTNASSAAPVGYEVASNFHAPVTEQLGGSLERQLFPGTSMTVTYLHSFGVHQQVTRNANQATGGTPQNTSGGYLNDYTSEAIFKQNQMIVSVNAKVGKNLSLLGFYTLSAANGNSNGGATNAYSLNNDYGRAGFVTRNSLFMMASYTGPWGVRFNPFLIAQSGNPYNITLATDTLNNFGDQRPSFAASASSCNSATGNYVQTQFGCLDTVPQAGEALIPVNLGNGPAAVALNLRVSRGFGIGPKIGGTTGPQDGGGGPPPGGGGDRGGRGGPGGGGPGGGLGPGGLGGGGGRGPGGMGGASTGRKYSLNFSVQALNLFNDIDYGKPVGVITPTLNTSTGILGPGAEFGKSTTLAGGIFSTGSAARRIFAQVNFTF